MKSVLISIQPKWCEKIANGQKTIEVRKTAPKQVPFKAYIYVTKGKPYLYRVDDDNKFELTNTLRAKTDEYVKDYNEQNGKVVGEFVCDRVTHMQAYCDECGMAHLTNIDIYTLQKTGLKYFELFDYITNGAAPTNMMDNGCLWHISGLKIYDKPKELSEFYTKKTCNSCKKSGYESTACMYDEDCKVPMPITRAPQSWQYVDDIEL